MAREERMMAAETPIAARGKKPARRWLRYSLRGLLLLMLLAALGAWWVRIALDDLNAEHDAILKLQAARVSIYTRPAQPQWFWRIVPRSIAHDPVRAWNLSAGGNNPPLNESQMRLLARLRGLKQLNISDLGITDDDLSACAGMTDLEDLMLANCRKLTHDGLRHFANAGKLLSLNLWLTPIDDGAMEVISRFTRLQSLRLLYTHVTDASMPQILSLKRLMILDLPRGVTSRGLRGIDALGQILHLGVWLHRGDDIKALSGVPGADVIRYPFRQTNGRGVGASEGFHSPLLAGHKRGGNQRCGAERIGRLPRFVGA